VWTDTVGSCASARDADRRIAYLESVLERCRTVLRNMPDRDPRAAVAASTDEWTQDNFAWA
jgi:hypothetical protein